MANTAADHSAVSTFPVAYRISITDANAWLAITVPPEAGKITLTAQTTDAMWQGGVTHDAAVGSDYGDLSAGSMVEIVLGPPRGIRRQTIIGIGSTTAGQTVEVVYEVMR